MKAQAHPPLQNLQGPPSLTIVPVCFFFGSGAVQKLFRSHPSRSPHPEETIRTSPSSPAGRGREAGQQRPRGAPHPHPLRSGVPHAHRARPSPVQHLDLQIFPRSKIMARRWLRSPRIRNTFMFQPAGPARARRQLLETLRRPRLLPRPWPARGSRAALRAPPSPALRPGRRRSASELSAGR